METKCEILDYLKISDAYFIGASQNSLEESLLNRMERVKNGNFIGKNRHEKYTCFQKSFFGYSYHLKSSALAVWCRWMYALHHKHN